MSLPPVDYALSPDGIPTYGKDNITGADAATFKRLNQTWAKDKKHVYSVGRRVSKADTASFQALNELYAKDDLRAYCYSGAIKEAVAASFTVLDTGRYSYERSNAFGDVVQSVDEFAGFAADKENVFHYVLSFGKPCILRGADRATFEVLPNSYGRDANRVYYEKAAVKGADPNSFEVIGRFWSRDRKAIYYCGTKIPSAEPSSFRVVSSYDFLGQDAKGFFDQAKKIHPAMAIPPGGSVPGYPLRTAKDMTMFRSYLERGATPNDSMALHQACRAGDLEKLQLLISAGCNPNLGDHAGNSALVEVIPAKNYMDLARLLVAAGADVNQMAYDSAASSMQQATVYSPLERALTAEKWDLAEYLVSQGASVNIAKGNGESLIGYYTRHKKGAKIVEFLKKHGVIASP